MAKTKSKSHSEIEHLRGENKKYRSENKHLKMKLKQLSKQAHFYEHIVEEEADDVSIKKDTCSSCGQGVLQVLDLTHVVIIRCDSCDYKKSKRPGNK